MRLLILLLFPALLSAQEYNDVIVSEVVNIYDGDSFTVNVNSWPDIVGYRIGIRVNGVDTPEMRAKCPQEKVLARQAKQFTVDMLRGGKVVKLRNLQRGKYFRVIADVYVDEKSLTRALIENNLGYEYHGGTRRGWCD